MKKVIVCMLKKIFPFNNPYQNSQIKYLEKKIDQELSNLESLSQEEKEKKNKDIKEMIRYYQDITEFIENRRNNIYNFSLQFLIICIAGIGLLASQKSNLKDLIFWPIMIVLIIQTLFSLLIIFVHARQSVFRYPFLKIEKYGNQWKWFYYGNEYILNIKYNFLNLLSSSIHLVHNLYHYLNGLELFIRKYKEENIDKEIKDNILQLYLFQVWNFFKNRFYLQLIKIRIISLIISVSAFLITFFYIIKITICIKIFIILFITFLTILFIIYMLFYEKP